MSTGFPPREDRLSDTDDGMPVSDCRLRVLALFVTGDFPSLISPEHLTVECVSTKICWFLQYFIVSLSKEMSAGVNMNNIQYEFSYWYI